MSDTVEPQPKPGWYWAWPKDAEKSEIVQVRPGGLVLNSSHPWLSRLIDYVKWMWMKESGQNYD